MKERAEVYLPDPAKIPAEQIGPVLARVAAFQGELAARLIEKPTSGDLADDRLLTIKEVCERMQASEDWIYRNSRKLPFAIKVGGNLRFSEKGLDLWIRKNSGRL